MNALPELTPDELAALPKDGGDRYNRLIFEKSPYLLQHADNPVRWFPWGEEAFETSRRENKPVFLSIGYATCHWCHVMAHESFEDPEVADAMNRTFVCIKVDREERPDIDQIYMAVTQALTGHGGWPMTVVMTGDKKPFFTGTYFSKQSRHGRMGMLDLVDALSDAWKNRRDEIDRSAEQIVAALNQASTGERSSILPEVLDSAFGMFRSQFDHRYGGFGGAPKFPTAHNLSYLLRFYVRTGNPDALNMVERTLSAMRRGGIYDHIGMGFHRYSTDERWFLPHFEKMLYDQALIAIAYTEAYAITKKSEYRETAEEIFEYVQRDMTHPEGGFYSAEDADSEGEEGKFYLWRLDELRSVLGEEDARIAAAVFNATSDGNYYEEATREYTGTNILYRNKDWDVLASELNLSEDRLLVCVKSIRERLFKARISRVHPLKDDKILTDWNGLMIAAMSIAAQAFDEPKLAHAAEQAADFIKKNLRDTNGRLLKRFRRGEAGLPAHADDYVFLIWGLIHLYEATGHAYHLEWALALNEELVARFWDHSEGGLFFTAKDGETLIMRSKEIYDGAIPSANSIAAINFLKLSRLTGNLSLVDHAEAIGNVFAASIKKAPFVYGQFLQAADWMFASVREIVVVGDPEDPKTRELIKVINGSFTPNKVVLYKYEDSGIEALAPFTQGYLLQDGQPAVYVCENFACRAPVTTPEALRKLL